MKNAAEENTMLHRFWLGVVLCLPISTVALAAPLSPATQADPHVLALLNKVQAATQAAGTMMADFTYTVTNPDGTVRQDAGSLRLMKPNFAFIDFDRDSPYHQIIASDGVTVWIYHPVTNRYTKMPADPQGRNINVWRLITIGGFFNVYTWMQNGVYVRDFQEVTDAGMETIGSVRYHVLEHKMVGTTQGKPTPFDQKVYIAPDHLIHRFTLAFTRDGKMGTEDAELTNIRLGTPMAASDFAYTLPPDAQEDTAAPPQ